MVRAPILTDAFFQVNLVDGFGFLDVRGALIRQFRDEFQGLAELTTANAFPQLLFKDPVDPDHPIVEFRVGVDQIWVHLRGGSSTVSMRQECGRIVDAACSLMNVTRFSRQGVRTQYLFGTDTADAALVALQDSGIVTDRLWDDLGQPQSAGISVTIQSGRLKAIIRLSPARRVREETSDDVLQTLPTEQPPLGVMLDIDAFDDARSDTRDPKPHINRATKYIEERALPFVARLLDEGSDS